jgi:hypothetical protein
MFVSSPLPIFDSPNPDERHGAPVETRREPSIGGHFPVTHHPSSTDIVLAGASPPYTASIGN